jgi:hypothetical protein
MSSYKTNDELRALLTSPADITAPGYEIELETGQWVNFGSGKHARTYRRHLSVSFWKGFFDQGRILDRVTGAAATRQRSVGLIVRTPDGFAYRLHSGCKASIRYGWTATEQEALDAIDRWVKRRFAFITRRAS